MDSILSVPGRWTHRTTHHSRPGPLWFKQRFITESRPAPWYEPGAKIRAELRFDDECGNGHNTFAITAGVVTARGRDLAGGCLHDDIARAFPELAPLIQWHLVSTDGPMHYIANTLHLAGDADCWGRRKGDPSSFEYGYRFGNSPISHRVSASFYKWIEARRAQNAGAFTVHAIAHEDRPGESFKFAPHYTLTGYADKWHDCPFSDEAAAQEFALALNTCEVTPTRSATAYSDGKARELESARSVACWPDATDAELCSDRETLRAALEARLPALLERFNAAMVSAGFMLEPTAEIRAQFE